MTHDSDPTPRPAGTTAGDTPARGPIATIGLLAAFVFGGMVLGIGIALTAGGGSTGALAVGFVALPLTFGLAMSAWKAVLVAWLTAGLARSLLRSGGDESRFRDEAKRSLRAVREGGQAGLPGTWVFLPVALLTGLAAAALMAILADGDGLVAAGLILVAALAYGIILRRLARHGRLPIPED
jgi:hypothetical protein